MTCKCLHSKCSTIFYTHVRICIPKRQNTPSLQTSTHLHKHDTHKTYKQIISWNTRKHIENINKRHLAYWFVVKDSLLVVNKAWFFPIQNGRASPNTKKKPEIGIVREEDLLLLNSNVVSNISPREKFTWSFLTENNGSENVYFFAIHSIFEFNILECFLKSSKKNFYF